MNRVVLEYGGKDSAPRTIDAQIWPDIDSSYTERTYTGERIAINTNQRTYGIKSWSSLPANMQGMAIWRNLLVRMANVSTSTTHYIYTIGPSGALTQVATFSLSTTRHSNTLQFAPTVEDGNTYPYLYVSDLDGGCEVLSIGTDYSVTQVQKITVPSGWQVQIGDDGHIWAIVGGGQNLRFLKYRKVAVSEGANISLTTSDILVDMAVSDSFNPNDYTFQGSKFKFGKAWLPIGTAGATQRRALLVYDTAQQRTVANIDLTDLGNVEFEDLDFWDDAMIIACYSSSTYILRF